MIAFLWFNIFDAYRPEQFSKQCWKNPELLVLLSKFWRTWTKFISNIKHWVKYEFSRCGILNCRINSCISWTQGEAEPLSFSWFWKIKIKLYGHSYRIYSINRPGRLLNFWALRVGAYSRWALIKFSPFSASEVCLFCNKTINANNKTRISNKARFL